MVENIQHPFLSAAITIVCGSLMMKKCFEWMKWTKSPTEPQLSSAVTLSSTQRLHERNCFWLVNDSCLQMWNELFPAGWSCYSPRQEELVNIVQAPTLGCVQDASMERGFRHFQLGEGPEVDPGHAGEFIFICWYGNSLVSSEELEEVAGEREAWASCWG